MAWSGVGGPGKKDFFGGLTLVEVVVALRLELRDDLDCGDVGQAGALFVIIALLTAWLHGDFLAVDHTQVRAVVLIRARTTQPPLVVVPLKAMGYSPALRRTSCPARRRCRAGSVCV